jgi:hypothetical protein
MDIAAVKKGFSIGELALHLNEMSNRQAVCLLLKGKTD